MTIDNTVSERLPASGEALRDMVESLEAQLVSLYEEREQLAYGHREAVEMVQSLEQQVAALLDERNELAAQLTRG
jgi:dsDNA-specific endonuclease/ATPase MutS2